MSNTDFIADNSSNPWGRPISNITWGFAFTVITFNFFSLQYILPTIGGALLYIGFYDLRMENKELNVAWIFSIINMVIELLNLIHVNTPLHIYHNNVNIKAFILTAFQVSFLLIFRKGLNKVFERAGVNPTKDPLLWLVIWRIIVVIYAITHLGSIWFIYLPLIYYYFYNFRSLYRLGNELSGINLIFSEVTVRFSSKKYALGYVIGCAFIVILCAVGYNHITLDSTEFIPSNNSETRDMLMDMGFPEAILKDISDDEVEVLKDAIYVDVSSELLMFDYKEESIKSEMGTYNVTKKPGKSNLEATSIYVELKDSSMYGLQYFQWQGSGSYWNDGFIVGGSVPLEFINGRLLYENKGTSYTASIPRLNNEMVLETDRFGSENKYKNITGAVNYPFGSEKQRGYVFYQLDLSSGVWLGCSSLNYIHYSNPFRFPYEETEQKNLIFNKKLRQHFTYFETKAYREAN